MKTKEELNAIKNEVETVSKKLNLDVETSEIEIKGKFKLTEDELKQVAGGAGLTCPCSSFYPEDGDWSNKTQSNCKYGISAHKNGVACPGAMMMGSGGPGRAS